MICKDGGLGGEGDGRFGIMVMREDLMGGMLGINQLTSRMDAARAVQSSALGFWTWYGISPRRRQMASPRLRDEDVEEGLIGMKVEAVREQQQ